MNPIRFDYPDLNDYMLASNPLTEEQVNQSIGLYLKNETHIGDYSLYAGAKGIVQLNAPMQIAYFIFDRIQRVALLALSFFGYTYMGRKFVIEWALLQIVEYATIKNLTISKENLETINSISWSRSPGSVKNSLSVLNHNEFKEEGALKTLKGID